MPLGYLTRRVPILRWATSEGRFTPDDPVIRMNSLSSIAPAVAASGVSMERFLEGTGLEPEDLHHNRKNLSWRQLVTVLGNLERAGFGRADFERIGAAAAGAPSLFVRRIAGFFVRSEHLLLFGFTVVAPAVFPVFRSRVERRGNRVRLELELPSSFPGCRAYFQICVGCAGAVPVIIGDPPGVVHAEIGSHRAVLEIDCVRRGALARTKRLIASPLHMAEVIKTLATQELAMRDSLIAVHESQRQFRAIIDALPDGVLIHRGGHIAYVNAALAAMVGRSADGLVETPWVDLVHPEDRPAARAAARAGGDLRIVQPSGAVAHLELSPAQDVTFEGGPAELVGIRDVTERRALQARLALADRAESLGLIAAGVAHEINNPLTVIVTSLTLARRADGRQALEAHLDAAAEGTERVRRIVDDLRIFSGPVEDQREEVDLAELVHSSVSLLSAQARGRATVKVRLEPVPPVQANRGRLGQVALNLLINALHAVDARPPREARIEVRLVAQGEHVVLEVEDNGEGIPAEVRSRIFDPFFTTKGARGGSGLGLAIAQGIVTSYGGELGFRTEVGRGTVFAVRLRATPARAPVDPPPARAGLAAAPRLRSILVIDDERSILRALEQVLADMGYAPVVAPSAGRALDILSSVDDFDHILCDLMMPEMSGGELFAVLQERHPRLAPRVVFMTGGTFRPETRAFLASIGNRCLPKPFTLEQLEQALHACAGGSR